MEVSNREQKSYTIYAGDVQIRTPQDQGPVQNAAFDKGIVSVSLRSLYTDASAAANFVELIRRTYADIPDPAAFGGIVGMGDYLDLGCKQEMNLFNISVRQMLEKNSELFFALLVPGNHDGGQYMGTASSTKNFLILGTGYPKFSQDALTGMCGEADQIQDRRDSVRDTFLMVNGLEESGKIPLEKATVHVKNGNQRRFHLRENRTYRFAEFPGTVFDILWQESPTKPGHWDSIIHFDREHSAEPKNNFSKILESAYNPFRKLTEFSRNSGDVHQWIQLQAQKQVEFKTDNDNITVPVYEIGLDNMDFTKTSDFSGAIKGHISELQISAVASYMDQMLALNPNAKFKLVMHYPVDELVGSARQALKRLLERDEVILLTDAHVHERGFKRDIRDELNLDRRTPLPNLTVPSVTDMPREVVLEEMSFTQTKTSVSQTASQGNIHFKFTFKSLEENDVPGADPVVFQALDALEARFAEMKTDVADKTKPPGLSEDDDATDQAKYRFLYINQDEVIEGFDKPMKKISEGQATRLMKFGQLFNMSVKSKGHASDKFIAQASIPQMETDFRFFMEYLKFIVTLLQMQGHDEQALALQIQMQGMNTTFEVWKKSHDRRSAQHLPYSEIKVYNSLYTDTDMQEVYRFLTEDLPEASYARAFFLIVGMRAAKEEQIYHGYDLAKVPDEVTAGTSFHIVGM